MSTTVSLADLGKEERTHAQTLREFLASYRRKAAASSSSAAVLDDVEFSLCGPNVLLCEEENQRRLFAEKKIDLHKDDVERLADDQNLIIRVNDVYYDVSTIPCVLPYLMSIVKDLESPVNFYSHCSWIQANLKLQTARGAEEICRRRRQSSTQRSPTARRKSEI